jgi:AcrR family transcriptional regulator
MPAWSPVRTCSGPSPALTETASRPQRRYGGQSAEQRRSDRERRLLDAGLELFGTRGFRATTVTDVCRAAAVAPTHFYEEHSGRESLLEAVYEEIMATTREAVDAAVAEADDDFRSQSRAGLDAFCHAMLDDPRRARVQCIEIVGVSEAMEARRHAGLLRWAALVANSFDLARPEVDRGSEPADLGTMPALRSIAVTLVGGVNEAIVDWLLEPDHQPIDELIDTLSAVFIATGEHLSVHPR